MKFKPEDQQAWVIITESGYPLSIHFTEDDALNSMRRTDTLYTCRMVNWAQLKGVS
jgi:hypothetical protein